MSDHNLEPKVKELLELKRMKEELEAEITAIEDEIKGRMGAEETLFAGAFKVTWTPYTSSRFDSVRFKKDHAELAEAYTKTTTTRRFSVR
jgi:predicted phage-related endonuclease